MIHSHLPIAAFMARIAGSLIGHKNQIYTVHNTDRWYSSKSIFNRVLRKIDVFLCNLKYSETIMISKSVNDYVIESEEKLNKNKIHIIHNAISFDEIDEKKSEYEDIDCIGITSNDYVLITIGRLDDQKGRIVLLRALNKLINQEGLSNIKCIIIGGAGNEKEDIEKFIRDNNLDKNIFLLGAQKNPYKFFKFANLFVMSSIYEGFGIVVLEAYYCKVPVLSSNADGLAEIVKHNVTGITFNNGDSDALAKEIKKFNNNEYKIQYYTNNAFEFVKGFNIEAYEERIRVVYNINRELGQRK